MKEAKYPVWEYQVHSLARHADVLTAIQSHGQEGWEVFSIIAEAHDAPVFVYMKRQRLEDEVRESEPAQPLGMIPKSALAPFYTVTDRDTTTTNSRSKRYASENEALSEARHRIQQNLCHGAGVYVLRAVALVAAQPIPDLIKFHAITLSIK